MIFESTNNDKFYKWIKIHPKTAAIITLLGGSDIGGLLILSSNFAGIKSLSVQFSNRAKNYIFWGTICNLFIEDIPQLLIQVC